MIESDDCERATLELSVSDDAAGTSTFVLTTTEGPDAPRSWSVDDSQPVRLLMGQSPACELRSTDPAVSRRHLALDVAKGRLRVTDLGSTNGTRVNGTRIVEALLEGGETLQVGETTFQVSRGERASSVRPSNAHAFGRLLGISAQMRRLYPLCERLAAAVVPVIIEGETGTGKEVLAESLHEQGPRANGPFVVFDCTSVAPTLLESELFGHDKGAFTGAESSRKGLFEQAHRGTLLIDELGELDLALQPKLLRVLERGEVRRLGSDRAIPVDVRILAATRRNLDLEVQEGRFRDDLFHRLAVARVELPPLRERRGDISMLARHFWAALGGDPRALLDAALRRWETAPWPGNVRELRNAVSRQLSLGELVDDHDAATVGPLSADTLEQVLAQALPFPQARQRVLEAFERRYVERALAQHGGNVARAAAASGLARRYFQIVKARSR